MQEVTFINHSQWTK